MDNVLTVVLRRKRWYLTEDEFAAYANLLRQLHPGLCPNPIAVQRLLSHPDIFVVFAYRNDVIVGTARIQVAPDCEGMLFHIDDVVVDEGSRRCGVGTALVLCLHDIARAHGAYEGELACNRTRIHARALYAQLGYTERSTCFSIDLRHST